MACLRFFSCLACDTHGGVAVLAADIPAAETALKLHKKELFFMANAQKIRIRLKAYDSELIDQSAEKIIETAKRNGAKVSGPIPLPTEKQIVTILRAVHKYKDAREQFERRTHKRLIDIMNPNQATIEALTTLDLPAGVEFEVKLNAR